MRIVRRSGSHWGIENRTENRKIVSGRGQVTRSWARHLAAAAAEGCRDQTLSTHVHLTNCAARRAQAEAPKRRQRWLRRQWI